MNEAPIKSDYHDEIKAWIEEELDDNAMQLNLKNLGVEDQKMPEYITLINKLRNKKRTRSGSILVLIGVVILGLGFISCIALHYMGYDINLSLYGLTGIGSILLIVGLFLLFS